MPKPTSTLTPTNQPTSTQPTSTRQTSTLTPTNQLQPTCNVNPTNPTGSQPKHQERINTQANCQPHVTKQHNQQSTNMYTTANVNNNQPTTNQPHITADHTTGKNSEMLALAENTPRCHARLVHQENYKKITTSKTAPTTIKEPQLTSLTSRRYNCEALSGKFGSSRFQATCIKVSRPRNECGQEFVWIL